MSRFDEQPSPFNIVLIIGFYFRRKFKKKLFLSSGSFHSTENFKENFSLMLAVKSLVTVCGHISVNIYLERSVKVKKFA